MRNRLAIPRVDGAFAGYATGMSREQSKLAHVDRPEPEEELSGPAARTRDYEPTDHDDRELLLDDPDLPAVAIDDDANPTGPDQRSRD